MYIVCRPLPVGDQVLASGTEVDASDWRNLRKLIDQRYLRPLTVEETLARRDAGDRTTDGDPAPRTRSGGTRCQSVADSHADRALSVR
jgi:hypothetical protein